MADDARAIVPTAAVAGRVLEQAVEGGATLFDTAARYGFAANEDWSAAFSRNRRGNIVLASKGDMTGVE